jgi:sugar O-acyltransferase (sialic acid O-acetyltransferase NeuD family)
VVGAGGHAKVVIETARAMGADHIAGVLDDDPARIGSEVLGVPVLGTIDVETIQRLGIARATLAIGSNRVRAELAARLAGRVAWVTLVHPSAVVAPSARIGKGAVVFAGTVIQPNAVIRRHAIINTGATVDHDCVIGDFAHIAPGVHLAGNVHIGEGAFMGIGSCAIPGARVGDWSTVGAGGVVVDDIPAHAVVKGVPAR